MQDVTSGAVTYGHRFLATSGRAGRAIKVRSFDEYRRKLAENFVILSRIERRDRILRDLSRALGGDGVIPSHARSVAPLPPFAGWVKGRHGGYGAPVWRCGRCSVLHSLEQRRCTCLILARTTVLRFPSGSNRQRHNTSRKGGADGSSSIALVS